MIEENGISASMIQHGDCAGEVLWLEQALSFWGGYDPRKGLVIDKHHPQYGESLTNRIVLIPGTRGSGGGPAGIAESVRLGTSPKAFILPENDTNLLVGVAVADKLYGKRVVVAQVAVEKFQLLGRCTHIEISNGRIYGRMPTQEKLP